MVHGDELLWLAAAAREGDDVALAALVRRTQPAVWRLCRNAAGGDDEVEDLVQETYARVVRALPSFREEAPVLAWVLSIARRVCADQVRRRTRHRRLVDRIGTLLPASAHTADVESTGLDPLVASLGSDRREAFVLTQELGLSYEEAAAVVGCPIGTIRSRVARARADLLAALGEADTA